MLRRYKPVMLTKIVASAAVPEFLNDDGTMRLHGLFFIGEKAVGTDNAGNVTIQIGGEDAIILEPGERLTWPQQPYEAGYMVPTDFKIKVAVDGDGVRVVGNQLL
jgi:hypothetical protein